jgi:hypothetical protein
VLTIAKKNTNFRLGLNRQQLIESAQIYGKSESSAKKSNTASLEKFVIKQLSGKGTPFPELSVSDKRDIQDNAEAWGTRDALKRLTYRVDKITGTRDEENFLRLTITDGFSLYYDGTVRREHIDELISRLPRLEATQVDSDMINISPYYRNLFIEYADELEELDREREAV